MEDEQEVESRDEISEAKEDVSEEENVVEDTTEQQHQINREEIVAKYKAALEEKEKLENENSVLQSTLSQYFKKRQFVAPEEILNISPSEQENNYNEILDEIGCLLEESAKFGQEFTLEMEHYQKELNDKEAEYKYAWTQLHELRKNVALKAVNSATGERLSRERVDWYLRKLDEAQEKKHNIYQEYLKELKILHHTEDQSKAINTENFTMTLNEYELMICECNIRNARAMEKKKEVSKLYTSCSEAVNIISHLKHKLHFLRKDKQIARNKIKVLQEQNDVMTKELLILKQHHESTTKVESQELQQKFTMIQDELLPNDFDQKNRLNIKLTYELKKLKERYSELISSLNRRKK